MFENIEWTEYGFVYDYHSLRKLIKNVSKENICIGDIYKCTYYWSSFDEIMKQYEEENRIRKLKGLHEIDGIDIEGCDRVEFKKELVKKSAMLVKLSESFFVDLEKFNKKDLKNSLKYPFSSSRPEIYLGINSNIMETKPIQEGQLFVDKDSISYPDLSMEDSNNSKVFTKKLIVTK